MLERRVLLAAMAATLATPAFAQNTRNEPANASKDPASPSPAAATTGSLEQKHMMETMAVGSLSLATSRLAVKKARDEDVKEFAEFEVAEQETIADVLMSIKDPSKVTGKVKPPSDSEARQHIPQDEQATLQKMEQMEGKEFEAAYIRAQTDGHQKLLRIQENYLANGKDLAHINLAKLARGQIKEHLTLLADLKDDDATTGRSSPAKK